MTVSSSDQKATIALWKIWLILSIFLILQALPLMVNYRAQEPDDYVRLLQVRDWINGQAWFDTRQYRMDAPIGADIHWVRLVDIPIAAAMLFFKTFLPLRAEETAAMTVVPLFQLYVAMWLLRELMRSLNAVGVELIIALAIVPLFPLLQSNFMPMRIDHHGWQAVAMLAVMWLLVRGGYKSAAFAGLISAAWLFISVEGMPLAAMLGGLFAANYWLFGRREHEGYLLGLALGGLGLFPLLRPLSEFDKGYCDMLSWPHFLAFGGCALAGLASRLLPGQQGRTGRMLSLVPMPLIAAPAVILPLGKCAVAPMAELEPELYQHWWRYLLESAPITEQEPSCVAMLLVTIAIIAYGARLARQRADTPEARLGWTYLAILGLWAGLLSLVVMRVSISAQLLALPFAGIILKEMIPRARAVESRWKRIGATFACFVLATPTGASALGKFFDGKNAYTLVKHPKLNEDGPCEVDRLRKIPAAKLFATVDRGPELLAHTEHSVITGGYHRNQKKMLEVMHAFSGPIVQARAIIEANNADYVMACTGSPDLAAYANAGQDNLADAIFAKSTPDWLEPVEGFAKGNLRLYRVR